MPYIVKTVGALVTSSNPSGAKNLVAATSFGQTGAGVCHLDDASNIIIYMTSSAAALTSSGTNVVKVAMFEIGDSTGTIVSEQYSTAFYTYNQYTTNANPSLSSGQAYTISNVAFKSLTVNIGLSSGNTDGEIVAWVAKQITV